MDSIPNGNNLLSSVNSSSIICGICKKEVEDRALTDTCSHEFCSECLKKWSEIPHNICPVCQQRFNNILSNFKSYDVYDSTPVHFDIDYVHEVTKQLFSKLDSSEDSDMRSSTSGHLFGPIGTSIEDILITNQSFIDHSERHHREYGFSFPVKGVAGCFQNIIINFTDKIVNTSQEHFTEDMVEELILLMIKSKTQDFGEFFTKFIEEKINSEDTSDEESSDSSQENSYVTNGFPSNLKPISIPKELVSVDVNPNVCPICKSDVTERALTDTCWHQFCLQCLKEWTEVPHNTCPVCRQEFNNIIWKITSEDIFDMIAVNFDLEFVEEVSEELLAMLKFSTNEELLDCYKMDIKFGPVYKAVANILNCSSSFLEMVEYHEKHHGLCTCLQWISQSFKCVLISFTKTVVTDILIRIDMSPDLIQELILLVLKIKRQEFSDFFIKYIEERNATNDNSVNQHSGVESNGQNEDNP